MFPVYPHENNLLYERNVAIALWNLTQKGIGNYAFAEEIMIQNGGQEGFRQYYDRYMAELAEPKRIEAWEIFDKCRCAYDMTLPDIIYLKFKGTVNGPALVLHATDNVGIAKVVFEAREKGNPSNHTPPVPLDCNSPSVEIPLDISSLGLASGQIAEVTCQVYDFEGVASESRPRPERCAEKIK
jgi:hypothetical protein